MGPAGGLQGIKVTGRKEGHLGLPGASAYVGTLEEREIHQHLKVLKMKPRGNGFGVCFPILGTQE